MPLPPPSETTHAHPAHPSALPVARLLQSSRPLRCLLIACLSIAAGWLLLDFLLPCLPADQASALLIAHLPTSTTPPFQFWLRLCITRFPYWLLLFMAGFTRFSGSMTSAVTVYRGLCDGAVLGLLVAANAGRILLSLPESYTGVELLKAFALWAAADLLIRLTMTLAARRIAGMEWSPCEEDGRMAPTVKKHLRHYLARCIGCLMATLAVCAIYTRLLI